MAQVLQTQANVLRLGSNPEMISMTVRVAFAVIIGLAAVVAAQEPDPPPDALIRLQRTSCFGSCPIYTVTIDARGTVTYEGEGRSESLVVERRRSKRRSSLGCWQEPKEFVSSKCATPIA